MRVAGKTLEELGTKYQRQMYIYSQAKLLVIPAGAGNFDVYHRLKRLGFWQIADDEQMLSLVCDLPEVPERHHDYRIIKMDEWFESLFQPGKETINCIRGQYYCVEQTLDEAHMDLPYMAVSQLEHYRRAC